MDPRSTIDDLLSDDQHRSVAVRYAEWTHDDALVALHYAGPRAAAVIWLAKGLPDTVLALAAQDDRADVRHAVAAKGAMERMPDTVARLASDACAGVREALVRNHHVPIDAIQGLADDPDNTVSWLVRERLTSR